MRDIKGDYKRAYLEEYEAYRRAGRPDDAERIAGILRDHYGHDVTGGKDAKKAAEPATPERTDAERPPENATPTKPAPRTAARKPAKKLGE